MSDLVAALAGGAIGSVLTAGFGQAARARVAWAEVDLHDQEVEERNRQMIAWVDDRTLRLAREMHRITEEFNARRALRSSPHTGALMDAKAQALHEFRDYEWDTRMAVSTIEADEGFWHHLWRIARGRSFPRLTARTEVEPFLDRWREPVTTGQGGTIVDRRRARSPTHAAIWSGCS